MKALHLRHEHHSKISLRNVNVTSAKSNNSHRWMDIQVIQRTVSNRLSTLRRPWNWFWFAHVRWILESLIFHSHWARIIIWKILSRQIFPSHICDTRPGEIKCNWCVPVTWKKNNKTRKKVLIFMLHGGKALFARFIMIWVAVPR